MMSEKVKSYINMCVMAFSLYFMGVIILKGHEQHAWKVLIEQNPLAEVSSTYYILAGLFGAVFGLALFWYLLNKPRKNAEEGTNKALSLKMVLKSTKAQITAAIMALLGLGAGAGLGIMAIGNLPEVSLPKIPATNLTQAPAESQEPEVVEDVFPIPDLPPVLPTDNQVKSAISGRIITLPTNVTGSFTTDAAGQSVMIVEDEGQLNLANGSVIKHGAEEDPAMAVDYGINSALLMRSGGILNMMAGRIDTYDQAAPAVSVNGRDSYAGLTDTLIRTYGNDSAGLQSMYQGLLNASGVQIFTYGNNASGMNIRKNSTIGLEKPVIQTQGYNAAIFQSAGTLNASSLNANSLAGPVGRMAEGAEVTLTSSAIAGTGDGGEGASGALIVIGQNEDAQQHMPAKLTFTETGMNFNANSPYIYSAPAFYANQAVYELTLDKSTISAPSGRLLIQNGGQGTLKLAGVRISAVVQVQEDGDLQIELTDSTTFSGNFMRESEQANIHLKLDDTSLLVLTGDCYLASLEDELADYSNIARNGFTLYVDGQPLE